MIRNLIRAAAKKVKKGSLAILLGMGYVDNLAAALLLSRYRGRFAEFLETETTVRSHYTPTPSIV